MTTDAVIDRLEGLLAVIEIHGQTYDLPLTCLPTGAKEGDSLSITTVISPKKDLSVPRERASGAEVIDI